MKYSLRVGRGGVAVREGPGERCGVGRAGETLREEARAAPTMALERLSPVMCLLIAFTDSRW